ncbi:MAG TPA: replicative DNA helicase [Candidatus Wunengus sp. YC60]|jgi:replicative DNA helicase|uniref:replicative DNA helicase n=1 Tax=Candidatus Wunengus sp. YC60 TaxID=3367697 RepID=UPI00402931D8
MENQTKYKTCDAHASRVMPHDEQAEMAVIGSMLYDNECIDNVHLSPDDFYSTANKIIFTAIMDIVNSGRVADLVTVCEGISTAGNMKKCGGPAYIAETIDAVISPASVGSYEQIVKEKSIERQIVAESQRMIEAVYDPSENSKTKLEEAQKTILNLSLTKGSDTLQGAREICKKTFAGIEYRYQNKFSMIGHPTGLCDLDSATSGLISGDLIIIAGRPGMGKSALAGNIAATVAASGVSVLLFSLEMPAESVMTRIISRESGINSRILRRGQLAETQWSSAVHATESISVWPIFIDDRADITPTEIMAKARKLKKEQGLGLLIVDYIQLVCPAGKHESREQAVAEISRTLKAIARELEIPVIGLSQLNRQVDSRPNKRPMLSDLRESGAIEQDADIIIFIYRDEVYNKAEDNPHRGIAEIDIAKHRNGETGRFDVIFDARTQHFKNKARI